MIADIIPLTFYTGSGTWLLWLVALGSIGVLAVGADRAVSAAAALARALGVSKVIIGATIVSLGTTTPEACVSVAAAWKGDPGLALGNAVGSIIVDTGMIFGLCCVIRRLPMDRFVLNRHGWLQLGAGALLTALCLGAWAWSGDLHSAVLPRSVGAVLLALLIGYLYISIRWARRHPQIVPDEADVPASRARGARGAAVTLLVLAAGLGLVVVGSDALVGSAEEICRRQGVPEAVLAVTLVAFGTSVPELVTAIVALIKGHEDLSIGNIVGADILNVLFVTGASNVAAPLRIEPAFFWLYLPTMMIVLLAFRTYILMGRDRFERWQGLVLVAVYVVFVWLTIRMGSQAP
jgi:cation:H+ antiporter